MTTSLFPVSYYTKTELAEAYTRGRFRGSYARHLLMTEIELHPDLCRRLEELGYKKNNRMLTRSQVAAIYEVLGPP